MKILTFEVNNTFHLVDTNLEIKEKVSRRTNLHFFINRNERLGVCRRCTHASHENLIAVNLAARQIFSSKRGKYQQQWGVCKIESCKSVLSLAEFFWEKMFTGALPLDTGWGRSRVETFLCGQGKQQVNIPDISHKRRKRRLWKFFSSEGNFFESEPEKHTWY